MLLLVPASKVEAGWIGFAVVLALVIASFLLFRSMRKHLRKIPRSFDPPAGRAGPPAADAGEPVRPPPADDAAV
jgi:hypothetical protein